MKLFRCLLVIAASWRSTVRLRSSTLLRISSLLGSMAAQKTATTL